MITHRRAGERHHHESRKQEVWLTFSGLGRADALDKGFGALEFLDEGRLAPGAGLRRHPSHYAEVITYVREGTLAYNDSLGRSGVIHAGEFQRRTAPRGVRRGAMNASRTDPAHVFQIWLCPSEAGLEAEEEQKRFSAADRRARLCPIASPDARGGALRLHQDTLVYSALLFPGQHLVHALAVGRRAWLHLVEGEVTLGDLVLTTGDGAGSTAELAVSLTAREPTEILLIDLGGPTALERTT